MSLVGKLRPAELLMLPAELSKIDRLKNATYVPKTPSYESRKSSYSTFIFFQHPEAKSRNVWDPPEPKNFNS